MGFMILNVTLFTNSFSFLPLVILQENIWLFIIFLLVSGLIIIIFLLETNRAPFDLAEAETELVAGYTVEYGGFYFGLYYLGEYLHLFFFSLTISILFFGGWELPNFLWLNSSSLYNTNVKNIYKWNDISSEDSEDLFHLVRIWGWVLAWGLFYKFVLGPSDDSIYVAPHIIEEPLSGEYT
jgi:formate hydrogenlyase subunit 4